MKKIISLIVMMAMLVGTVLSTASCSGLASLIGEIIPDSEGDSGNDNGGAGTPGLPDTDEGGRDDGNDTGSGDTGNDGGDDPIGSGDDGAQSSGSVSDGFLPDRDETQDAANGLTGKTRALFSTVTIITKFEVSYGSIYGGSQTSTDTSAGAGVIYKLDKENGDAYIITNYHVVYNANAVSANGISNDIKLYLYGQEYTDYAITATYLGGAMNYDIAILKVENSDIIKNSPVVTAAIGDSEKVRVFDEVYAVGNPEAYGMAVTEGIISVESESLSMTGADGRTAVSFRVMRVSAAINSGNSGGGLYDTEGRLIGIVNAKRQGSDIDNIAYAIPVNLAVALAENIIYHCDGLLKTAVYRCLLGVSIKADSTGVVIDPNTQSATIVDVVKVSEVQENSIVSGMLLVGDIVTAITIDGVRYSVTRTHHVPENMFTAKVGSTVTLTVTRGSSSLDVTITIPESAQSAVR